MAGSFSTLGKLGSSESVLSLLKHYGYLRYQNTNNNDFVRDQGWGRIDGYWLVIKGGKLTNSSEDNPADQTQEDPNLRRMLNMADKYYFYGEKKEINWIVDYDGKGQTPKGGGSTSPGLNKLGKRDVYINPGAFVSDENLFIVMGHEYVHTLDYDNGVFDRIYTNYNQKIAHHYLEIRTYTWSVAAEKYLGVNFNAQSMLDLSTVNFKAELNKFNK